MTRPPAGRNRNIEVLFLRNIDPGLKRAFKAACARAGTTMTGNIRKYMLEYIRGDAPPEIHRLQRRSSI